MSEPGPISFTAERSLIDAHPKPRYGDAHGEDRFNQLLASYYPYAATPALSNNRNQAPARLTTAIEAAHNRDRRRQPGD